MYSMYVYTVFKKEVFGKYLVALFLRSLRVFQ